MSCFIVKRRIIVAWLLAVDGRIFGCGGHCHYAVVSISCKRVIFEAGFEWSSGG